MTRPVQPGQGGKVRQQRRPRACGPRACGPRTCGPRTCSGVRLACSALKGLGAFVCSLHRLAAVHPSSRYKPRGHGAGRRVRQRGNVGRERVCDRRTGWRRSRRGQGRGAARCWSLRLSHRGVWTPCLAVPGESEQACEVLPGTGWRSPRRRRAARGGTAEGGKVYGRARCGGGRHATGISKPRANSRTVVPAPFKRCTRHVLPVPSCRAGAPGPCRNRALQGGPGPRRHGTVPAYSVAGPRWGLF